MDYYTVLIGSGLFACTYFCLYPKKFKQKVTNISWYSVKFYHKAGLYIKELFNYGDDKIYFDPESSESSESSESEEEEDDYIILEGLSEDKIETYKLYENQNVEKVVYDLLYLVCIEDKKECYKQINNDEIVKDYFDYEIQKFSPKPSEKLHRQFLQIEIVYDKDSKYDIHEYISRYYIEGNVLFNPVFMNYYMKKWYNFDEDHNEIDYKINIIDKDIKLLNLVKGDYLVLTENSYEKKFESTEETSEEDEN